MQCRLCTGMTRRLLEGVEGQREGFRRFTYTSLVFSNVLTMLFYYCY